MLPRILEPELMDRDEDAHQYDAMDHASVNIQFVGDFLDALTNWSLSWTGQQPVKHDATAFNVLDLGAGTAQIPIELARRAPPLHITAVDAAKSMLALARKNITAAGLASRIELFFADAKQMPFDSATFPIVISNSIMHHIPEPCQVIAEAFRVTAPGGLLFHRDLARPRDEIELHQLVTTYAAESTPYQRKLFNDSLEAALTLEEMRELVTSFGFDPDTCHMTSDRHWTWSATKP